MVVVWLASRFHCCLLCKCVLVYISLELRISLHLVVDAICLFGCMRYATIHIRWVLLTLHFICFIVFNMRVLCYICCLCSKWRITLWTAYDSNIRILFGLPYLVCCLHLVWQCVFYTGFYSKLPYCKYVFFLSLSHCISKCFGRPFVRFLIWSISRVIPVASHVNCVK